jgi:hypothetical protein
MEAITIQRPNTNTIESFAIVCNINDKKALNDALSHLMAIIDTKYIETNVAYDTDMKCLIDDDEYIGDLSELNMIDQVITLYNDVFGVPSGAYEHYIEVTTNHSIGDKLHLIIELCEYKHIDHTLITF